MENFHFQEIDIQFYDRDLAQEITNMGNNILLGWKFM